MDDLATSGEHRPAEPDAFTIPATASLQERRPRTLKQGDTFAVFDRNGNILPTAGAAEGLYHRDTRHLSLLDLVISGARPILLSSTIREDNATLSCDLTNPDLDQPNGRTLEHDLVHIRRTKFLWQGACHERVAVRNFSDAPQDLVLAVQFAADFVDLFEVRGMTRPARGIADAPVVTEGCVELGYTGLDAVRRRTRLRFDPAPEVLAGDHAVWRLRLAPGELAVAHLEIACDPGLPPSRRARDGFFVAIRDARRALRTAASRACAIETGNEIFNECIRRCVADLYMLITDTAEGPYPYAGIPWYSTVFGRDALITALMTLWTDPAIARGVLRHLAANQATTTDAASDAEPGKILHEVRRGEMAELGEVPFRRYYGSVDATPLFVMLAGAYLRRTGDLATARDLWPHVEAALGWIDTGGDRDGDGFVEYFRQTESGLANQGWKDSHDSVFHADGRPAEGPIALVEVQGYVFAARLEAAGMAESLGLRERALTLRAQAEQLRHDIEASFWCEALGTYALALDGAKRPCQVRSSNAGHLLTTGVAAPDRAARVAAGLLGSAFFSGWGVRTLAAGEPRYNPMSYHNGSVWPHDNALIGIGFPQYGLQVAAARILEGLFEASVHIDLRRLPELVCGFPRRRGQGPTFYPVACAPQAWAAATPLSLLQSCLGLSFDPAQRIVRFDRPVMPGFTDRVILRGLAIADARMDVLLRGVGDAVSLTVLSRRGDIRAIVMS